MKFPSVFATHMIFGGTTFSHSYASITLMQQHADASIRVVLAKLYQIKQWHNGKML